MKYVTSLLVFLALLWWILSGYTKPLLLSLGVVSILFTAFLAHRMRVVDEESHPVHISFKLLRLWAHLAWGIVSANIMVASMILGFRRDLRPQVVTGPVRQKSDLARVILANSATLSPGSVTLDIRHDFIVAHAINEQSAEEIRSGDLDRWVSNGLEENT